MCNFLSHSLNQNSVTERVEEERWRQKNTLIITLSYVLMCCWKLDLSSVKTSSTLNPLYFTFRRSECVWSEVRVEVEWVGESGVKLVMWMESS